MQILSRFPRLANLLVAIVTALGLTACSLTPTQKKWATVAAGVLVVGAIAAHDADDPSRTTNKSLPSDPCSSGNAQSCE